MLRAIVIETPAPLAGPRTRFARLAVTRGPDGRWIGVIEVAGNPYGPWRWPKAGDPMCKSCMPSDLNGPIPDSVRVR